MRLLWFSLCSLFAGLAVASRVDYIFCLPFIALGAFWAGRKIIETAGRARLAIATILPATVIGALLAAYNAARFGDLFEFGLKYQMSRMAQFHFAQFRAAFIPFNFHWYLASVPSLTPYFPYFLPLNTKLRPANYSGYEAVHGNFLCGALAVFVLSTLAVLAKMRVSLPIELRGFLVLLAGMVVCLLVFICSFGFCRG